MCVEFDPKIGIFRLILYQIISFSQKKIHDELERIHRKLHACRLIKDSMHIRRKDGGGSGVNDRLQGVITRLLAA
jgi:hypothetical protein